MALEGIIVPFGLLLMRTEYDIVVTHIIINEIHFSWKPIFCIIPSKKGHSTRSYALLMSSLMAIRPFFPFLFWSMQCIVSKATWTLSVICLPRTKALWDLLITSRRIFFNLLASTFDTILYTTLYRLKGLNSVIF